MQINTFHMKNILVCISQIPETTSKINFTDNNQNIDYQGVQFIINPSDESALTKAIQIKETTGANVTLIHLGDANSEPTLRKAFAVGADKMIRIDAQATDGYSVAQQIYQAIKNTTYDLIFCGKESLDYHGGMVGGMLATLLGIDFIDNVISVDIEQDSIKVERETESGKELLSAQFPLLIAVQKELISEAEIKIPNIRGIMNARKVPIEIITGQSTPKTAITSLEKPAAKPPIKMIDPNNLDELINELHNNKKVI